MPLEGRVSSRGFSVSRSGFAPKLHEDMPALQKLGETVQNSWVPIRVYSRDSRASLVSSFSPTFYLPIRIKMPAASARMPVTIAGIPM